jgi:hypothetical protein
MLATTYLKAKLHSAKGVAQDNTIVYCQVARLSFLKETLNLKALGIQ